MLHCRHPAPRRDRLYPCDAKLMDNAEAPPALVDVPTTVAPAPRPGPSQIALPMPREAPVTRATCFSSMCKSLAGGPAWRRVRRQLKLDLPAPRIRAPGAFSMRRLRAVRTFPGPHSTICPTPPLCNCTYGGPPLHRPRELLTEVRSNFRGIIVRGDVDRAQTLNAGVCESRRLPAAHRGAGRPRA